MPTDNEGFLEAILAEPDDDTHRLVYGDWLKEKNDPRGEFIHLQCALASMGRADPRYQELAQRSDELLRQHREATGPRA